MSNSVTSYVCPPVSAAAGAKVARMPPPERATAPATGLAVESTTVKLAMLLAVLVVVSGCGGVLLNAKYSQLLDETAALSEETARRAERGDLDANSMVQALRYQADVWQKFRDGRDGLAPEDD